MKRIRENSYVSTEAWRFDSASCKPEDRWSYKHFGEQWMDARVYGKVVGRCGNKWKVRWDMDDECSEMDTDILFHEDESKGPNATTSSSENGKPEAQLDDKIIQNTQSKDPNVTTSSSENEKTEIKLDDKIIQNTQSKGNCQATTSSYNDTNGTDDTDNYEDIEFETEERSELLELRQKNIEENLKMMKILGFNVSDNKFHRHVKKNPSQSSSNANVSDIQKLKPKELLDGQEVYLTFVVKNSQIPTAIFRAKFQETSDSSCVHGKEIKETQGRFFITRVLTGASKWDDFDVDTMCEGAPILWEKNQVRLISTPAVIPKQGTEAKEPTLLESKKRKRQPELWQKNKKKKAVNTGEEFEYEENGEVKKIERREMKPACPSTCRLKCSERISGEERMKIFEDFYALGDKSLQSVQIASLVSHQPKKRNRSRGDVKKRNREFTSLYTLVVQKNVMPVCSIMFLNTLCINEKRVRTVLNNKTETGAPKQDGRGRHGNHKTEEEKASYVIKHIQKFQVLESHYVRKGTKYEYLPSSLSVAEMYRMYNEWRVQKKYPEVTYVFHYTIFKERFNLKFDQPKKDSCDVCDSYKNYKSSDITEEMAHNQAVHLKEKETVRSLKDLMKQRAKNEKEVVTVAFDMQKVLLTPFGQSSLFYYSRRLLNNNFTITEIDNMSTYCYFWNESECKKGSCEVATSLMQYILTRSKEGIKEFNFFCDRCGGQNNNRMLLVMLSHLINQYEITAINLVYLVSGHSQSENDNAHSLIEQTARNKTIFTPAEWRQSSSVL